MSSMDLGREIKIIVDDTIFDILDDYDDTDSWDLAEIIFNFLYYAKSEKSIPCETTEVVCEYGRDKWDAGFMKYVSIVVGSNEIDFEADDYGESIERLAEISVVEHEEILVLSKRELEVFDDNDNILVWSPEQFSKFAQNHSGFKDHIESMKSE
jgi:hypothetical protein